MSAVGESPSRLAKPAKDIRPDRLDNIHRVELGPQRASQLAPDRHPQVGLISQEGPFRSHDITIVEPLDELIQMVDTHVSLVDQLPGSSGNPRSSSLLR